MKKLDNQKLPQRVRWKIAELLIEDRLGKANEVSCVAVPKNTFYTKYGKRLLDILIGGIAFVVFLPINIIIAIISFFDVGKPLFFLQERNGRDGKIFKIVKFRSMTNETDKFGNLLPADQRITKWGRFIRKTSLDELLNFWSIIKGDMSIIGPRPLPPQYYSRYSERHKKRLAVAPGLECPPKDYKVPRNGWNDWFENDIWYVENVSFWTDLHLLIQLFRFTFDKKRIYNRASGMTSDFIGYSEDGTKAIGIYDVPAEYVEKAIKICNVSEKEIEAYKES